jgi:hypothetical protein
MTYETDILAVDQEGEKRPQPQTTAHAPHLLRLRLGVDHYDMSTP